MLYICTMFCKNISNCFRVTDLNIRVEARVVANIDARTDARRENWIPIPQHAKGRHDKKRWEFHFVLLHFPMSNIKKNQGTVELQWLKHCWDHENMFETGVVQANKC